MHRISHVLYERRDTSCAFVQVNLPPSHHLIIEKTRLVVGGHSSISHSVGISHGRD